MPLEINREAVFVDMRLTSLGRQLASLGRLRYSSVVFSDQEVDYTYETPTNDLGENFVISPFDAAQNIRPINFDGSPALKLGPKNVRRGRENSEVHFLDSEFFSSGATGFAVNITKCIAVGTVVTSSMLGTDQMLINTIGLGTPEQASGTSS